MLYLSCTIQSKYMKTITTLDKTENNNLTKKVSESIVALIKDFDFEVETGNVDWGVNSGTDGGVSMNYNLTEDVVIVFDYDLYFNPQLNNCLIDNLEVFIKEEEQILSLDIKNPILNAIENNINTELN